MAKGEPSTTVTSSKDETTTTTHWLFQPQAITITIQPITLLSLFVVVIAAYYTNEYLRGDHLCELVLDEGDRITWFELPRGKVSEDYASLDNGAFVCRQIYMDEFLE